MQVNVQFLQQLQPEWSRFVTIVKQQHKLDEVSYHKCFDILKQYQNEVNELRAEKLARNANALALVATAQASQDQYYQTSRSHRSSAPSPKPSIPSRSYTSTRHKGKEIAKPITPPSETTFEEDSDPEQAQRDKDMQKNLALIAKYFKKIYKPTNNNLRTSSKSKNKNVDTTHGIRKTVILDSLGLRGQKPKRVKDSAYHKEKMLLCKQAEQCVPLQAEHYDWLADTDEEVNEQELEAHYSYMAKIQEVPTADSGNDSEPVEQVQNDVGYNVFANKLQHFEQSESVSNTCLVETDDSNVTPDSPDMCEDDIQNEQNDAESDDEHVALANLIANLKLDVDENKKIQKQLKKANTTLAQELKECKAILAKTSKSLGESISVRDSCLVALQTKQTEFEKYKAFNDRTIDYDKLERKLNEALGQLAHKDTVIREGLKTKAYELSVEKDAEVQGRHADKQAEIYNIDLDHSSKVVAASTPIPAAKPKILKIAAAPAISTRRRKGVVIRDPEEELHTNTLAETPTVKDKGKGILIEALKPMKKKDQVEMDAEYAKKLQKELDKEHEEAYKQIDWNAALDHVQSKEPQYIKRYNRIKKKPQSESEARKNMISYLKNTEGYKMEFFKGKTYDQILPIFQARFDANIKFLFKTREEMEKEDEEIIKSINETPAQKAAKRRKLMIDNKPKYKIIRADDTHQFYISFTTLLKNFDREDLETLWRIVGDRFSTSKPTNISDEYLLLTLKTMFGELDGQDAIWRNQKSVYGLALVKRWKLLTSCGVHVIILSTVQLFLLVERRYPLSRFTLEQLVNVARLQVEEESEMSLELLRFTRQQLLEYQQG
nr:hypothetical protein [Tanacetum cinerariifolium]